jgi:carboxyl-terminal processing protease
MKQAFCRRLFKLSTLYLLIATFFIFVPACKKGTAINYSKNPDNLQKVFLQFWDKMNYHYVYWDKETTDWDLIYQKYKPLFDNLSDSDEDKKKAVVYFKEMTERLVDNHYQITFGPRMPGNSTIDPALDRKRKAETFHEKYNYEALVKPYLDQGFISGRANIRINGTLLSATTGTINSEVLYFQCNFFALEQAFGLGDNNKVKEALAYFFSRLNDKVKPVKGIILDLRNNPGGNVVDLNFFGGKLVDRDRLFGYTRGKSGLGRLGYLPWLESRLRHDPNATGSAPIVLLMDSYSASLAELMIIALKSEKNICIGESTYGATGPISDPLIFNAGSFTIGEYLSVRTSSVQFKDADGRFYEGIGLSPNIYAPFDAKNVAIGKDSQLELAISRFK